MKKTSIILTTKNQFLELYHSGVYPNGSKLPSEPQMAKLLGVSRETWRNAVRLLIHENLLISKHGSGTYVCGKPPLISNDLSKLESLTKMLTSGGISNSTSSCSFGYIPENIWRLFSDQLNSFYCVKKTRYQKDTVVSTSYHYIPSKYNFDMNTIPDSILNYFEDEHHIHIVRACTELLVPDSNDHLYQESSLPLDVPVIRFNQLHFDTKGNPIFYGIDYLRCDKFNFTILRSTR